MREGGGVGNEGCLCNDIFTRLSDLQLIKLRQNLQIIFFLNRIAYVVLIPSNSNYLMMYKQWFINKPILFLEYVAN